MWRLFSSFWWKDVWYNQVSSRLRPRNKWLTKQIPRTWCDKDHLLEICVLGALKNFVEPDGENCFNILSTDEPPLDLPLDDSYYSQAKLLREVKWNYDLATQKLVSLQKELEAEWNAVPVRTLADINKSTQDDYDKLYGNIDRLEKEIYDLQTEIMVWVVKNRNGLWT